MSAPHKTSWSTLSPGCILSFDLATPELHVPSTLLGGIGQASDLIPSAHHIHRGAILMSAPPCACLLWHMGTISAFC